ncbi:MAG: HD domain-containing protein [Dehalococcoidia bacterium]
MSVAIKERPELLAPKEATSLLDSLKDLLQRRSIECYVVGGFVRDGLLGRVNRDIDVAVSGNAIEIASSVAGDLGARVIPLNEANQVARIVLRRAGHEWHLDFATLRGSIEEDLQLRDFTINAIATALPDFAGGFSEAHIIDPLGGRLDLSRRVVRATGSDCFLNDPARLLRAIRFAAVLDFSIDRDTEALIQRDHRLITTVAAERLRDELWHILETPRAYQSLQHLERLGMLKEIMPELCVTEGVTQPKEHFWNVFDHSLHTVDTVERVLRERDFQEDDEVLSLAPWSSEIAEHVGGEISAGRSRKALVKLAGLLHDIGKPATKTVEEDGRMRFLGHAKEGAAATAGLMERLRFSNREINLVQSMVEHHMRSGDLLKGGVPSRRAIYRFFRDTADVGIETLLLGLADHLAARGPSLDLGEWRKHCEMTQYVLSSWFEEQARIVPPKLIDGHMLIERFGMAPGSQIGELLEIVREAQAAGEVETMEQAMDLIAMRLERLG